MRKSPLTALAAALLSCGILSSLPHPELYAQSGCADCSSGVPCDANTALGMGSSATGDASGSSMGDSGYSDGIGDAQNYVQNGSSVDSSGLGAAGSGNNYRGSLGLLASGTGATTGRQGTNSGMTGDFFGGSYSMLVTSAGMQTNSPSSIAIGGGDRRFKLADNYNPLPTNRAFINYNHFHRALFTADGREANLNRAVLGLEKTFWDDSNSIEFRLPFTSGLSSSQSVRQDADNVQGEFGNIALAWKTILLSRRNVTFAGGLGIVLPTASDSELYDFGDDLAFQIQNEAVYLQPFVGMLYTPNDRLFVNALTQLDIDTNGNTVDLVTHRQTAEGRMQDQTLLFIDVSVGYWIHRASRRNALITGIAPMLELHYSTTTENSDFVDLSPDFGTTDVITNFSNRLDVLNLTGALRTEIAGHTYLTVAGVAPLRDEDDKLFDAELAVQLSRLY